MGDFFDELEERNRRAKEEYEQKQRAYAKLKRARSVAGLREALASGMTEEEWCEKNEARQCAHCGWKPSWYNRHKLHRHHHKGYGPGHETDVIVLCASCHHKLHARGPS